MLFLSTYASAGFEEIISFPSESCHAMVAPGSTFSGTPVDDAYKGATSRTKVDIACVGRNILLDRTIRSNGGNVYIYADTLTIAVTIDTRAYTDLKSYRHYPGVVCYGKALCSREAAPLFDDYYDRANDALVIGSKRYVPELISGRTKYWGTYCEEDTPRDEFNGTPPPDAAINSSFLNSGDIFVYAREIHFKAAAGAADITEGDPLDCATPATKRQIYFLADGSRGGRGGAGKIGGVFGGPGGCVNSSYERVGYLNAPGGKGANAGNVSITLLGGPRAQSELDTIGHMSSARGGNPGSALKLRTPAYRGQFAAKSYDVCGFIVEGHWPESPQGSSGTVDVRYADNTAGLVEFSRLLGLSDASFSHDLNELAERTFNDKRVAAPDFTRYLEKSLYAELALTQLRFIEKLNAKVLNSSEPSAEIVSRHLTNLDPARLDTLLFRDGMVQAAVEIRRFDGNTTDDYFINRGGAFNLRDSNVHSSWAALALRTEAAQLPSQLSEIKQGLTDANILLNSINEVLWTREFRDRLNSLRAELAAAQSILAANGDIAKLQRIAAAGNEVLEGISAAYGGYQSGNPGLALGGIGKIAEGAQHLQSAIEAGRSEADKIANLTAQIARVEAELNNFLRATAEARERFLVRNASALLNFLEQRDSFSSRLDSRTHLFGDLLSASILSYFSDPTRDLREFTFNLRSIYSFVANYPQRNPSFVLRSPINTECSTTQIIPCQVVDGVVYNHQLIKINALNKWYSGLPAYVLAPSRNKIPLKTYGEELTHSNFFGSPALTQPSYSPISSTPKSAPLYP